MIISKKESFRLLLKSIDLSLYFYFLKLNLIPNISPSSTINFFYTSKFYKAVISLTAVALLTFVKDIYFFLFNSPSKFSLPISSILFKTFICLSFRALLLCLSQNFVFCIILINLYNLNFNIQLF